MYNDSFAKKVNTASKYFVLISKQQKSKWFCNSGHFVHFSAKFDTRKKKKKEPKIS